MLNNKVASLATLAGREVEISTGVMAKQANGSVVLTCGNMVLLATAVMSKAPREGIDFFPLMVEYQEKMYASGKIPGGFFKRENRPSVGATLISRLIDRPIRPLFPESFFHEIQVAVAVLSYDETFSPEPFAIIAASVALSVSDIPFQGPVGAAVVGWKDGQYLVNAGYEEMRDSTLNIIVAGTADAILMVEAGALEVSEDVIIGAIELAHAHIKSSVSLQESLVSKAGKPKVEVNIPVRDAELVQVIEKLVGDSIDQAMAFGDKEKVDAFLADLEKTVFQTCVDENETNKQAVKAIYANYKKKKIRETIILKKRRPDGRCLDEIRPIESEVGVLPSVHGSALFTRGETQSLTSVTLGTADDEQIEDGLAESSRKSYYFHYNFPPYSVGEIGFYGRTGRRELGHGALAERALVAVLPDKDAFPYTVRLVSEILESNGSSSMASVCAGSLALMDCGVPITSSVSGIAMGLLLDENEYVVLSDIQGLEDHYGDMDFKVAGTISGITALQLDIKVKGLSQDILIKALSQAKTGRLHILCEMNKQLAHPRHIVSPNAPKIEMIHIPPDKVGMVIGSGGKTIRKIEEDTKASVIILDGTSGQVCLSARNQQDLDAAKAIILSLIKEVEAGDVYHGKVTKIMNFGAFVEILPGKEGLVHISTLSKKRIERIEDYLSVGQAFSVKVKEIDSQHRINLVPLEPFES